GLHLPPLLEAHAEILSAVLAAATSRRPTPVSEQLFAIAHRMRDAGDSQPAEASFPAVCTLLWSGHLHELRLWTEEFDALPRLHREMLDLHVRALQGPPWTVPHVGADRDTTFHYERALLHYLRGEDSLAAELLRHRRDALVADRGSTVERFTPNFPGALVTA